MNFMRRGLRAEKNAVPPSDGMDMPIQPPYMAGMDEYDEQESMPTGVTKEMERQGFWSKRDLDRFAWLMRRGVTEQ